MSLHACPRCGRHVFAKDVEARGACPFCASKRGLAKGVFASVAGAAAFVSGIGCAYGMPADRYVENDGGHTAAEASVGDGRAPDGAVDASDASRDASDGGADADLDAADDATDQ